MTKTFLQEGLDAYARGDYLAAARAWCRGQSENPRDAAIGQYLQFLRGIAPAVVLGAEEEAAANAKTDRPPAAMVRNPGGTIAPLIDAPDQEIVRGRTIDMRPTEMRPGKTIDMRPTEPRPNKTIDMSAKAPQPEDLPEPPRARVEEGKAEWSPPSSAKAEGLESRPVDPHVAHDDSADERASVHGPRDEDPEEQVSALADKASDVEMPSEPEALEVSAPADLPPAMTPPPPPLEASDSPHQTDPEPAAKNDPWGEPALLGPTAAVDSAAPGLALVAEVTKVKSTAPVSAASLAARMRDAAGLDDFSGALKAADELLVLEPFNVDAKRIRDRARSVLTQMLVSELGTLDAIPMVVVAADQVIWLDLDQRSGFVLAQVDGRSSFSDIVAVTGMDELETLGILARLVRDKIVTAG